MCGGLVSAFFLKLQAKGPWPYLTHHAGLIVITLGFDLLGVSPIRNAYGFAPLVWLLKGAALFVIALGISTLWQGLLYILAI
jgi:hypothetical protein